MSLRGDRVLAAVMLLALAAITCNIPSNVSAPVPPTDTAALSADDIANTAAARALTAQAAAAPSATTAPLATAVPAATQCNPSVTATLDANVRSGPGTAYNIVGYLPTGGTAPIAGRNDSATWWYIQFAGGYGGYAWIAASVVTPACVPAVVQVVAAPPLPTAPPTATLVSGLVPLMPPLHILPLLPLGDIVLQDVFLSTNGEVIARVAVSPTGSLTGNVTFKVWRDGTLQATITKALPTGSIAYWSGVFVSGTHTVKVKVDTGNAYNETDEGNNDWQGSLTH